MSSRYHSGDDYQIIDEVNIVKSKSPRKIKTLNTLIDEIQILEGKINDLEKNVSYLTDIIIDITTAFNNNNNNNNICLSNTINYIIIKLFTIFVYITGLFLSFKYINGDYPITYSNEEQNWVFNPLIIETKKNIWNQIIQFNSNK